MLWSWLARHWPRWRKVLVFVQPATVFAWQRTRFPGHWAPLSRGQPGRPAITKELRTLIRDISAANPRWGSPWILGEVRKLGIAVAKSTVEKYRVRPRRPTSPTWRPFLKNHLTELVALGFFTVPTVGFKVLFVLIVLAHERRKILDFNVTERPTARWTSQQFVEAFPWDAAPKSLLRDRDAICLWRVLSVACRDPWHRPSPDRPSESLVESLCRANDRKYPAGVSGSRGGLQRGSPSAPPYQLFSLLSPLAYAPVAGHGLRGHPPGTTAKAGRGRRVPGSGWTPSPL